MNIYESLHSISTTRGSFRVAQRSGVVKGVDPLSILKFDIQEVIKGKYDQMSLNWFNPNHYREMKNMFFFSKPLRIPFSVYNFSHV